MAQDPALMMRIPESCVGGVYSMRLGSTVYAKVG